MAVGAFKIVGQDGTLNNALPFAIGISAGQAGLAAGAEASFTVTMSRSLSVDGTTTDFVYAATAFPSGSEANVQYVAEVIAPSIAGINTTVSVKAKNVGSAAGAQTYHVGVIAIPNGVA